MLGYSHLHQKVSPVTAVDPRLSLSGDPDALSVVDTCRDRHLDLLSAGNISAAIAVRAFLLYDLAGSLTVRTCLHVLYLSKEGLLVINDLSFPVTLGAGHRRGSRLCTRSMAFGAFILQV